MPMSKIFTNSISFIFSNIGLFLRKRYTLYFTNSPNFSYMNRLLMILGLFLCLQMNVSAQTCNAVPVPFLQSFSTGALPACWTNQNPTTTSTNANVKWKFSGSAGYGATGNGGKPAGSFAWVDASSPYANEHTVELISPQINLTGLTNPYVKFEWFKNHLTSATGTVPNYEHNALKLAVNNGTGWVQIWSDNSNNDEWRTVGVPLAASYVGATIQLKFTVDKDVAGNGYFYDDVLLDEVQVIQAPTCFEPLALPVTNIAPNSATLNWSPPPSPATAPAGGYEYFYSTNNTPPTAATIGTVIPGTSDNISLLTSGATYYWWVRSVCSASDKSPWVEGQSFTPGQIGGGTATHGFLPVYSCSGYSYSQQIYTTTEIASAVGTNNLITSIKYFVSSTAATQANYNQWVVYMGNTTQTDFATTTSWIPSGSLTQVYSGTLPAMTAGTWIEIPLATPFLWNGTSNVVIAVDENSTGTSCTANWGSYSAGANRGMIYYNGTTNPNPLNPPTATSRYAVLPRLQLVGAALPPCTNVPPTNITVSNITSSSATVTWSVSQNATYVVRYRTLPAGSWQTINVTTPFTNNISIPGLTEQTQYEVEIATICGTQGAFSSPVAFTTPALTYCNMIGTGTNDYISNVSVTPVNFPVMSNTTLQDNYSNYITPATLINLEIGSVGNQLSVSKGWVGTAYGDAVHAWIDWNRDGIFTDSEKIMSSASNTLSPVTASFDVPATGVYTGTNTTTMRVVLKRGSAPVMCVDPANGEVEDYAVRLRPCSNITPGNPTFNTITHNSVIINWTAATNNNSFVLEYRPVTTPASAWTTLNVSPLAGNPPVQINGLTPATTYEVRVAATCGSSGIGVFTPITTFITRCDPTPPNVTVTNITANSVLVTWDPIVPNATYVLQWREQGTVLWNTPTLPPPPANTYTIPNLDSYKTYEVVVASICNGETAPNPWSNTQVFTTERLCEVPPPGFTITQLNPTSAEVVWDPFPGATYLLRYRKVGIPSWTNVPVSTNTYTITGLLELTKYEMQVANICNGNPGNFTPLYYFITPTVIYCPMQSANFANEYVSKVTAKPNGKPEMINESAGSNYSDFTGDPKKFIEMIQGSTGNQLIIDKNIGSGAKAGVAVWIDFDRNGTFDLDERILADGPNTNPTASTVFIVPSDAFISITDHKYVVMRVAMAKDGIPVNCISFADGEVEDYTVRISKLPVPNSLDQTSIMIYPNPVKSVLNVKNISEKASYKIYSAAGRLVSSGLIVNNKIDVSVLISGVYIIDIDDVNGNVQKKFIKE